MKGHFTSAPPGGFTLATASCGLDEEVVSICRRLRAAGRDFGLDSQDIRALTAGTHEAARLARIAGAAGEVQLVLADGPALQVLVRARLESSREPLTQLFESLRPLVPHSWLSENGGELLLALSISFPESSATSRIHAPAVHHKEEVVQSIPADTAHITRQLQAELEETNRGVVALYAELEERAERLRQAEDRLRLLLDGLRDYAICMLNAQGEVTSWNAGAERLFGYGADQIVGRHIDSFYVAAERDAGLPAIHLAEADRDGRIAFECRQVRRDASAFDAHVLLTAVRGADGGLRGFSLVVRDITERKRLEDDLRRRAEDLAAANRTKEDFLATLSHELRTPLNAMLGWTRLLRSGRLDAAGVERALGTIERNARIQEQLIADILDMSRIVTGKLRLQLRPVDLVPIIDAAVDTVRPTALAKGVHLEVAVRSQASVLGDPDRLQQVIWNLLTNAIKFTHAGGHVGLLLVRAPTAAVLTVTDDGDGIAPELLPFVFDRFRQGDGSVTRPHSGLGLGLSIVRHLVETHGGMVGAASEGPGRGATFSLHLPVLTTEQPPEDRHGRVVGRSPES